MNLMSHLSLSPSLVQERRGAAKEIKFLLNWNLLEGIESDIGKALSLDPYCVNQPESSYLVESLYLDTTDRKVLHRQDGYRKHKYRVRRYGQSGPLFVERKTKRNSIVQKFRTAIEFSDLATIPRQAGLETDTKQGEEANPWKGAWFRDEISTKQLQPACKLSYFRRAYFGEISNIAVRVTIDRDLTASLQNEWAIDTSDPMHCVLPLDQSTFILELKFVDELPLLFKKLIADFQLSPATFSKYRNSIGKLIANDAGDSTQNLQCGAELDCDTRQIRPVPSPHFGNASSGIQVKDECCM